MTSTHAEPPGPRLPELELDGYLEPLVVAPGGTVELKASAADNSASAQVAAVAPRGARAVAQRHPSPERFELSEQTIRLGSYGAAFGLPRIDSPTVSIWVVPSTCAPTAQGLIGTWRLADRTGWGLALFDHAVVFNVGGIRCESRAAAGHRGLAPHHRALRRAQGRRSDQHPTAEDPRRPAEGRGGRSKGQAT